MSVVAAPLTTPMTRRDCPRARNRRRKGLQGSPADPPRASAAEHRRSRFSE